MTKKVNKLFILIALVLCVSVVLCACQTQGSFTPATTVEAGEVIGNGGIAVSCGGYVYYVNGYESTTTAENTYEDSIRVGQIVRIKEEDLSHIFEKSFSGYGTSQAQINVTSHIRNKVEVVVPNYYYSANSSDTTITGLYIFNNRLYVTSPSTDLDSAGRKLSSQLKLYSYALDGSDRKELFTFTDNSTQIMLTEVGDKLFATYYVSSSSSIFSLEVGTDTPVTISSKATNVKFEKSNDSLIFNNENNAICYFKAGESQSKVIVSNYKPHEDHDHYRFTFTIVGINKGIVYYTVADANNSSVANKVLYYASADEVADHASDQANSTHVCLSTVPTSTYLCWDKKVIYVSQESSLYAVKKFGEGDSAPVDVNPALAANKNENSITLVKVEGNTLYYTKNSVTYTLDLTQATASPVAFAYSLSTTATGWSVPDVLTFRAGQYHYVFTLATGSVSVVKFDCSAKTNSTSYNVTLTAE